MCDDELRARARALNIRLGVRVRACRVAAGLSLEALAAQLGITYQQVQKYERGSNRISAATLCMIALALGVRPAALLEEIVEVHPAEGRRDQAKIEALISTPGGNELVDAFLAMPKSLRRAILELAIATAQGRPAASRAAEAEDPPLPNLVWLPGRP